MSSSPISSFIHASQKVIIYCGILILITGVTGCLLNVIIFRSMKIFRQSSCIFYLTIMSIANMGQLITGLLPRILVNGFNIDWTQSSVFYCKFRWFCPYVCALISLTCMCFATIDQFLATCASRRWQKWSDIKVAHVATAISICIWLIYGIPYLIYVDIITSSLTGNPECTATNKNFYQYHNYSSLWFLGGLLPVAINAIFGLLVYFNVQRSSQPIISLIRYELDRQLQIIVYIQIIYNFVAIVPFIIVTILIVDLMIMKDLLLTAKLQFANVVTFCLYYLNVFVSVHYRMDFALNLFISRVHSISILH
jgi:hypothetical protein